MLALLLLACTGADSKDTAADDTASHETGETGTTDECERTEGATGTLALSFAMEPDYIPSMDEPPVGMFYGSVFHCEDVGMAGPVDGAEALEGISVEVDLQPEGGPTAVLYTTGELPSEKLYVLGYLDTDANGIDQGDPVTLPSSNTVVAAPGAETPFQVYFGLLNP